VASAIARFARHLRLKAAEITTSRQQLNGHRTAIKRQKERIENLRQQLLQATASSHAEGGDASPDRILADIARNKLLRANGRRYSLNTLPWTNEIFTTLPAAYRTVRAIVLISSEEPFRKRFLDFKLGVRHTLTDVLCVDGLIETW
jgi:hypothetical protein